MKTTHMPTKDRDNKKKQSTYITETFIKIFVTFKYNITNVVHIRKISLQIFLTFKINDVSSYR